MLLWHNDPSRPQPPHHSDRNNLVARAEIYVVGAKIRWKKV